MGQTTDAADIARPVAACADAPAEAHSGDRSWIDRTIDAALQGVFSADPDPEAEELPAVDLLLLRSGDTWVGVPWDNVAGLGLSDDAESGGRPAPLSLRAILGMEDQPDGGEVAAEPYCLTWKTETGLRTLCCEVLGGVVAAPAAAGRGVDLVWVPGDSATGGRLLPLVEYFASGCRGDREEVTEEARGPRCPGGSDCVVGAARSPAGSDRVVGAARSPGGSDYVAGAARSPAGSDRVVGAARSPGGSDYVVGAARSPGTRGGAVPAGASAVPGVAGHAGTFAPVRISAPDDYFGT